MTDRKRLPPGGKQFSEARQRGLIPKKSGFGHIIAAMDWRKSCAGLPCIVFPTDTQPDRLNLSFAAGLYVTIVHDDAQRPRVAGAVDALFVAGAERVDSVNLDALLRGENLDCAWPRFEVRHAH